MARTITAHQKHQLMTKMLQTANGRRMIAQTIQEPLRQLRDYQAVGRKAFLVDELPDGALPIYDKDINVQSYVVTETGDSIQQVVQGTRLMVPIFEIASYPKIPFVHVKERRFDVISRIKKKSRDELFRGEDRRIFQMMDAAGTVNTENEVIPVGTSNFDMSTMAEAFAGIEKHGHRVDKVYMNANEYKVFRNAGRDYVDFETQRELLRTGFMGLLWGAQIFTSPEVAIGDIFCVTEPEYFGVIPVRIDLTVVPADDPGNRMFGWSVFEALGMGIHNAKGIQQVVVS